MTTRSNKGRLSDFCLPLYLLVEAEFMPFVDSLRKRPQRGDNELAGYTGLSCEVRLFKVAMICSRTGDTFYNVTQRVVILSALNRPISNVQKCVLNIKV